MTDHPETPQQRSRRRTRGGEPHPFDGVDLRAQPRRYRIGRGEYGIFHAEPYRSELLPLWRFRTPDDARQSAAAIWARFEAYRAEGDFVGMDVARKFLQMGYTRARRYAKYPGGRKFDADGQPRPVGDLDPLKAEAAQIFHAALQRALADPLYQRLKREHQARAARQT